MTKRILMIAFLIIVYMLLIKYKVKTSFASKIDINLETNEIGVIIDDESKFLIVKRNNESALILLDLTNEKKVNNYLSIFGINKINYLFTDNNDFKINYDYKYSLNGKTNLMFMHLNHKENILNVKLYGYNFCIYKDGINKDLTNCTFIYFYDTNDDIVINEKNKVVFYQKDISEEFKEKLYTKWIDIYQIDSSNYLTLKIKNDNYNIINIPK